MGENTLPAEIDTIAEGMGIEMDDPEVIKSATKIQAGFRGKKAREDVEKIKEENNSNNGTDFQQNETATVADENTTENTLPAEIDTIAEGMGIEMDDPKVIKSATKIQAGFRGKKAREDVMKIKEDKNPNNNTDMQQNETNTASDKVITITQEINEN